MKQISDVSDKEVLESAYLIASAPKTADERDRLKVINAELLKALTRLASGEAFVMPGKTSPEMKARMQFARATIAKAKGEYGRSVEEALANVMLVGASPDMLKQLRACRDMLLEAAKQFRLNGPVDHGDMTHLTGVVCTCNNRKGYTMKIHPTEGNISSNISDIHTEETGGGVIVDYVVLQNGVTLAIGVDSIYVYTSEELARNEPDDYYEIVQTT